MDKRRAFRNWTLNIIENSNLFQPFVEKTFAITFVNTRPEQAKNAMLLEVIGELEADVSSRNWQVFKKAEQLETQLAEEQAKNAMLLEVIGELEADVSSRNWQVFKRAEQLETQLAEVQFRTWRSGGETCHFNFNSSNLVPRAVPFLRTMDKRRAFQNWTLNIIENSNLFQPFVEKTFAITFVNTRQEQAKNAMLLEVIGELEADVSRRNWQVFKKAEQLETQLAEEQAKNAMLLEVIGELEADVSSRNWQVFKRAEQLETQLAEVQFRTWRSGGETCHFNFNSSNLVPRAVPFLRTMDKRRAFQNWTLNIIENSNLFQPFVEKNLCHHLCEHSPGASQECNAVGSHRGTGGRRFAPKLAGLQKGRAARNSVGGGASQECNAVGSHRGTGGRRFEPKLAGLQKGRAARNSVGGGAVPNLEKWWRNLSFQFQVKEFGAYGSSVYTYYGQAPSLSELNTQRHWKFNSVPTVRRKNFAITCVNTRQEKAKNAYLLQVIGEPGKGEKPIPPGGHWGTWGQSRKNDDSAPAVCTEYKAHCNRKRVSYFNLIL